MCRLQVIGLIFVLASAASARPLGRAADVPRPLPVVVWHGMGDSCCDASTVGGLVNFIRDKLGKERKSGRWALGDLGADLTAICAAVAGVYVYSIATGSTEFGDVWSSFYGKINDQVDTQEALKCQIAAGSTNCLFVCAFVGACSA